LGLAKAGNKNMTDTTKALNVGISIIMTEHFFTFTLSSLPTTKRFFAKDNEGIQDVRKSYLIAMVLSLTFSGITSYLLRDPLGFITSLALSLIFVWLYERALQGRI